EHGYNCSELDSKAGWRTGLPDATGALRKSVVGNHSSREKGLLFVSHYIASGRACLISGGVQLVLVFAFLMASAALAGVKTESAPALMPMPAEVRLGGGKLLIEASFSIRMNGYSDQKLQAAASRLTTRISRQTGIPITGGDRPVLTIECRAAAPETPRLGEDE